MHETPAPRRKQTLWPIPGGVGLYVPNLRRIVRGASARDSTAEAHQWVIDSFATVNSTSVAAGTTEVACDLGMLERRNGRFVRTTTGDAFVRTGRREIVLVQLITRITAVEEMIEVLRATPLRIGLLQQVLLDAGHISWQTDKQVRYRLRWLEELGVLHREGKARPVYSVTARGCAIVVRELR